MPDLEELLQESAALHDHLCPRQVLGVRTGLLAARLFGLDLPLADKHLFAFVETDGCYADGISVATGCRLGHRTMRLVVFGKVACTLVDTHVDRALRIAPRPEARGHALLIAPGEANSWHAQLAAYRTMPDDDLLGVQVVRLSVPLDAILSRPGLRVRCAACGEEIMNEREVCSEGRTLCRSCAGVERYYCSDAPEETLDLRSSYSGLQDTGDDHT